MKKILFIAAVIVAFATSAYAEWQVDFKDTYFNKGIDQAVVDALKVGENPESIVAIGLTLDGLNPQNLIMALYCAGAASQDIKDAAAKYEISEMVVMAGYKKAVVECGDAVADSQAYTPVASGFSAGPISGSSTSHASVSTY